MNPFTFITFFFLLVPLSSPHPLNARLQRAYTALHSWKRTFTHDPNNLTSNWIGPNVCSYTGVFCAPAPDDPRSLTVAGIDINHAAICGSLHPSLSLLSDLALLHLNSNSFHGTVPGCLSILHRLFELDLSNNQLSGTFPPAVLRLPSLRYLDLRFNNFHGDVPKAVFDLPLDALFLNNNDLRLSIADNVGRSPVSVLVLANNRIDGCIPPTIANMSKTLNELMIANSGLRSCIPPEMGRLERLTVLDLSGNQLVGALPAGVGELRELEQLNVARNVLSGEVPEAVCRLPRLENFTYAYNYFSSEPEGCAGSGSDGRWNCVPDGRLQRPAEECSAVLSKPVACPPPGDG